MMTPISQRSILRGCQGSDPLWKTALIASNALGFFCRYEKSQISVHEAPTTPSGRLVVFHAGPQAASLRSARRLARQWL